MAIAILSACGSTVYNDFMGASAWAVSQDGAGNDSVTVVWSKSDNLIPETQFYTDTFFNPPLNYFGVQPGYQGKARFHFDSSTNYEYCDYSTVAINNAYGTDLTQENWSGRGYGLFLSTYTANYPTGYTGASVPQGSTGTISGDAQCEYANQITDIWVDSNTGTDGSATLSNDGNGGENYTYNLPAEASSYQLHVTCNGNVYLTPSGLTQQSFNWACVSSTLQHICAKA